MKYMTTLIFILFVANGALASNVVKYFFTGNDYMQLLTNNPNISDVQDLYVAGVNDALVTDNIWLRDCTLTKPPSQLTAILNSYLSKHPGTWDKPAPLLYIAAMKSICKIT